MASYAGSTVDLAVDNSGYVDIAQVVDIGTLPGIEVDDIEISSRSSANDWGEFIGGFKQAGEGQFDIVYDPEAVSHALLISLAVAKTVKTWKFTLPGTSNEITVSGYVKSFKPKAPLKDKLAADLVIKFTGAPTFPS